MDQLLLGCQMALLQYRGLTGLNARLIQARTKIFDTVAEHNFAALLLRHHPRSVSVDYEPDEGAPRPIDFRLRLGAKIFRMQMKRLASLQAENRKERLLEHLARQASDLPIARFFECDLSVDFGDADLQALLEFVTQTAAVATEGTSYDFAPKGKPIARVQFWMPRSANVTRLTLGAGGDLEPIDITGQVADQLRSSVRNAASAFTHPTDPNNINLVVIESDKQKDIDVADACFGTEEELFSSNGVHSWTRQNDGLFEESMISSHVAAVIVLRRQRWKPISDYDVLLYINPAHLCSVSAILSVLPTRLVVQSHMRPGTTGQFDP
jgi:hypothetical protein